MYTVSTDTENNGKKMYQLLVHLAYTLNQFLKQCLKRLKKTFEKAVCEFHNIIFDKERLNYNLQDHKRKEKGMEIYRKQTEHVIRTRPKTKIF